MRWRIRRDPEAKKYTDVAISPAAQDDKSLFELYRRDRSLQGGGRRGHLPGRNRRDGAADEAKLLRVLQENEVTPVGDTRPVKVDVRVVSATNRDLKVALNQRAIREDLYYRLAVFPIRLPPLRERREDIPLLAAQFLEAAAQRHHRNLRGLDAGTVDLLSRYEWPGNMRELQK